MRKICPNCNSRICLKEEFCLTCGHYVERKFNEPVMWLGWETY
ncbi:MAG: hypothetical protein Q8O89_04525 [Nanoarchaeota archaeon]|nr:hypothetical protein [Nanoarchaeota archaeon]